MLKTKTVALASLVCLVGFSAYIYRNQEVSAPQRGLTGTLSSKVSKTRNAPVLAQVSTKEAAQIEYSVDFETALDAERDELDVSGSGHFALVLTEREPAGDYLVLSGQAKGVALALDADSKTPGMDEDQLSTDLQQPFAVLFDRSGRIVKFGMPGTAALSAQGLLKAVLSTLQYLPASDAQASAWQKDEVDHLGQYQAQYKALDTLRVEKTKNYQKPAVAAGIAGLTQTAAQADGKVVFTLSESNPWPERIQAEERFALMGNRLQQRITLTLAERSTAKRAGVDLASFTFSNFGAATESTSRTHKRSRSRQQAAQLVAGASYSDLMDALAKTQNDKTKGTARHQLLDRLTALFEIAPDAVADAMRSLRSGATGKETGTVLGALAGASSESALKALNGIASDTALSPALRSDTIRSLGIQATPTSENISTLKRLQQDSNSDVRGNAVLALGSAAHAAAKTPELSKDAELADRELANGYRSAKTPADRTLYLKALGNVGSATTLTAAKEALGSSDPEARIDAVRALRFVPSEEAEQLIAQVWTRDTEPEVRLAAIFAAGFRNAASPPLAEAALQALAQDQDEAVRVATLRYMIDHVATNTAFALAISKAAGEDPSEDVRENARRFMNSI